jgi:hypothetical protein
MKWFEYVMIFKKKILDTFDNIEARLILKINIRLFDSTHKLLKSGKGKLLQLQ